MKKIVLLGATSNISKYLIPMLLEKSDNEITLFARRANQRLTEYNENSQITLIDGDWNNISDLREAIKGQDIVYMATGHFVEANQNIVKVMKEEHVKRLIVAGGLGIYDEVAGKFGKWNARMMGDYTNIKKAAAVIDNSGLDYTFLRMSWLYNQDGNYNYDIVPQGQPMKGTQVTRQAIAKLISNIIASPDLYKSQSIGVVEPNTEWDKPSFY
ncbi:NAD(P)H-binding protein [Companilactobacillus pabuli]|jgi:Predicted nucleoside-diphosphate-sugar epimerases|uniref:NAD(P)H-binding protein n=1 Tax=Companilactobacillus pabuli TaxID=2714036 RepID=A0A7L7KW80_9LACO|nr:NAD(P)H-binding protein [Companilactobacillus pabuli]AKP03918.1 saccharopine dehydrogenase [Companilactobacillus farciminis]AKS52223.1 saccharopine dehydrogenase [Companilactobacillus farciminis]MDG5113162.1 NAD(P)H-binding protein [Companilactobacillus pabuli]QMT84023.1 NAD(P)H-binding protein [Companilactobacillus pabuli]GAQ00248.1 putative oxidoreductase [Companilactobacillus farciminis]